MGYRHSQLKIQSLSDYPKIEVRVYKWPRRPTNITQAYLIGEDLFGKWVGVAEGDPWWAADGTRSGVFIETLVKVFPVNTFWTACFYSGDTSIDVDISIPVEWVDSGVEEIDLELDVLRSASGQVTVRDQDKFRHICDELGLPPEIARQAENACRDICHMIECRDEPFGEVGFTWLAEFLQMVKQVPE
jgi:hypothetical protein